MAHQARRIHRDLTPDELTRLKEAQDAVARERPDLIRRDQLRKTASEESTFSGELRRTIHSSDLRLTQIAKRCGITPLVLDEFLTGEGTLPSDVINKLVEVLGCKLVPLQ